MPTNPTNSPSPPRSTTDPAPETKPPNQQTSPPGTAEPSGTQTPLTLQAGARPVPDYELVRRLGKGGFGEVWQARGPGGLDCALKFIELEARGSQLEVRALEMMKSIRHPNLVGLAGVWQRDNVLILAMELCDRSLQDRLNEALAQQQCGLPMNEVLKYMRDAACGLDALHAKKVQHRDVKPLNLLLMRGGVKVADFGLAKVLESTVASHTGAMTPAYAAPEFIKGETSQHSDQYSLAASYVHLRTGHTLFTGNYHQIANSHLAVPPDLSELQEGERAAVARALDKNPDKRWPSCEAFVNALIKAFNSERHSSKPKAGKSKPVPTDPKPKTTKTTRVPPVAKSQTSKTAEELFNLPTVYPSSDGPKKGREEPRHWREVWTILVGTVGILTAFAIGGGGTWWMIHKRPAPEQQTPAQPIAIGQQNLEQEEANLAADIAAAAAVTLKKGSSESYYLEKGAARADSWHAAATRGSLRGAYLWGRALQVGRGVPKDEQEAVKWIRKVADQGDAFAQNNLGVCYQDGSGVSKDEQEAIKWYRKAADQGDAFAQNNLGACYDKGAGVIKDGQEAVKWYRKAAEQGYALAQNNLGASYDKGDGVARDEQEAVKWYRKAAEQGYSWAQNNLGWCYAKGTGVIKDEQEAVKWYCKAAEQGNALAQTNLGVCYYNGTGVAKDEQEAIKWFRKAADQGEAVAQTNLGIFYENGTGVAKDVQEAVKWYRKAADQGEARAQTNLGFCYAKGTGVIKDEQEAVKWYRLAADQGYALGQNNLGVCYYNGTGVAKDEQEAVKWYRLAAKQGNSSAIANLKTLGINP